MKRNECAENGSDGMYVIVINNIFTLECVQFALKVKISFNNMLIVIE